MCVYTAALQDWSAPGDFKNLGLHWHEPSPEEIQLCEKLLQEFLKPEVNMLKEVIINKKHIDRLVNSYVCMCTYVIILVFSSVCTFFSDSLQQSLQLILRILLGAAAYLPMLNGSQVEGW